MQSDLLYYQSNLRTNFIRSDFVDDDSEIKRMLIKLVISASGEEEEIYFAPENDVEWKQLDSINGISVNAG